MQFTTAAFTVLATIAMVEPLAFPRPPPSTQIPDSYEKYNVGIAFDFLWYTGGIERNKYGMVKTVIFGVAFGFFDLA
jgi:hypothetical protein